MKSITIGLVVVAVGLLLMPTSVEAAVKKLSPSQQKQLSQLKTELKHTKTGKGTPAKTILLVKKLVKLDPKQSEKYFTLAVAKFPPVLRAAMAARLAAVVTSVLQNSGLSASQIARLVGNVTAANNTINPPPSPPPYQAWLGAGLAVG